jgi:hypothetical protein
MKELLEAIAKALVDNPDQVHVRAVAAEHVTVLEQRVHPLMEKWMFRDEVDLRQKTDQREALLQSLIGYSGLRDRSRGEQIGDVTYHTTDPDISKLLSSEFAPKIETAHVADSHIRFLVISLRSSGWVFRSTIPSG